MDTEPERRGIRRRDTTPDGHASLASDADTVIRNGRPISDSIIQTVASSNGAPTPAGVEPDGQAAPLSYEAVMAQIVKGTDPWAMLAEIEATVPREGRGLFIEQAIAIVASVKSPATRDMLIQRVVEVFPGVRTTTIRDGITRLLPVKADDQRLAIEDVEPWPERVDGAALADEIAAVFERFVALPPGALDAITLYAFYTHAFDAFDVAPMLVLTSPEKRCGKTLTLRLLSKLVRRPLLTSNISAAAIFRVVDKFAPTLIVDEIETQTAGNEALRGIVDAAHDRDAAYVIRCDGDDHEPRRFDVYGAKILAGIGKQHATWEDRAVIVRMRRRAPGERIARWRASRDAGPLVEMQRKLSTWAADNSSTLEHADPLTPDEFNDRAADNAQTLFAIADALGGHWPARARTAVSTLMGAIDDGEASTGVRLLRDVREVLKAAPRADVWAADDLLRWLWAIEDAPWGAYQPTRYQPARPLTARDLAALLKPFDIQPAKVHGGRKRYHRSALEDAFMRYLTAEPPKQGPRTPRGPRDDAGDARGDDRGDDEGHHETPVNTRAGEHGDGGDAVSGDERTRTAVRRSPVSFPAPSPNGTQRPRQAVPVLRRRQAI